MRRVMVLATVLLMGVSTLWALTPNEMYTIGLGYLRDENYTQAVEWWRKAAEQGHKFAILILSSLEK